MTGESVVASAVGVGDRFLSCEGFAPVVSSNPERQSAASASFGLWEITYRVPGRPTFRWLGPPDGLVEVLR